MSCCSRYVRFSWVSFVLVRYMSATLFMSCSMWLYLSLISVNFPDTSPDSWWMSMLECLVMNLLSPHIDIRDADDAAYPSTNVCTSVSMYLMRSHMYRVGIREPPVLVICIEITFVLLFSSLICLAMLSQWMRVSPNLAQFSSVISPTILMFSCEVETMDGFGITISVGVSGSSSILCCLSSKFIYVRKEDVLDMISLLDNVSFVLCDAWLLVIKFLL